MIDPMQLDLEARTRDARNDPRTTHEFIRISLTEPDEDTAWNAVVTLHFRATKEVFDAACQLCASDCAQERTLGANILGQLGIPDRIFPNESLEVLLPLLDIESDEEAICAICIALGFLHVPAAIRSLARLKTHSSAKVRYAAVYGLLGFEDNLAIRTLIELSGDGDVRVRDWSTFGLGSQIAADTQELREALVRRLSDDDEMTRGEALVGLAARNDARVIEPLIEELAHYSDAEYGEYGLKAAEKIADERLLPVLTRLKQSAGADDSTFDEAIRRCSGQPMETTKNA